MLSTTSTSANAVEITTGTGADAVTVEGMGEMTFDQPAGQAREFYAFEDGSPTERITRYDLGKIFTKNPPMCGIEDVTGSMLPFFGWVAQAKQGPSDEVNGITDAQPEAELVQATQQLPQVGLTRSAAIFP